MKIEKLFMDSSVLEKLYVEGHITKYGSKFAVVYRGRPYSLCQEVTELPFVFLHEGLYYVGRIHQYPGGYESVVMGDMTEVCYPLMKEDAKTPVTEYLNLARYAKKAF